MLLSVMALDMNVTQLFKRAVLGNLTFCLIPIQGGIARPILTHSYHNMFPDGGGV